LTGGARHAHGGGATRLQLLRQRRRLARVAKGIELLRRKREALVAELFRLARPAADARERIAERAGSAYAALLEALAGHGRTALRPLGWPEREVRVEVQPAEVWGVAVSGIEAPAVSRSLAARGLAPGLAGPAATAAAAEFEALVDLLLAAAPRELLLRRLGEALASTSRRMNTLERGVEPGLRRDIAAVRRSLDERESEERVRLRGLQRKRRAG